jgi:N utilization substance protein B
MAKISTKTIARMASIQALYEFEINSRTASIDQIVETIINYYGASDFKSIFEIPDGVSVKLHANYMRELVAYTINNLAKIDDIITVHLAPGWSYEAMHIALVSILRVAISELLYFPEVPYKVVINEFTTLSSEIVKDSEVPFVNSLLDHVRMEYRPENDQ